MAAFTWNIEPILRSSEHHSAFQRDGFIVVDLLNQGDIEHLRQSFERFHPNPEPGFHTTTFNQDVNYRKDVHAAIHEIVAPRIAVFFEQHKIHFCSFIHKSPGEKSELIVHQDMSLLDESRYNGTNIWAPLIDLTEQNGAIQLLPRSHRLFPTYRGASLPDIYDGMVDEVKKLLQPFYLKAGQAVIFDQSIIHYSPPNYSDVVRPVVNTFVSHQEAPLQTYWTNREEMPGEVEVFRQQPDFMFNFPNFGHDIFNRPAVGESIGRVKYDFPSLTSEKLQEFYPEYTGQSERRERIDSLSEGGEQADFQRERGIWGKFKQLFGGRG